jgi:hypothetical protein
MKELSEDIRRWFKEKWTAQDGSPCGAYKGRGRVKCRPSKRVSSKTAQTWGEMSKSEKRKAVRTKQKAHKKGHQFSSHKSGKTWKGTKYKPKKRRLKESVEVDKAFLKNFIMDAIKNPRKFYTLLTLSGMQSQDAYRIIYNLKHPRLTSSSFKTKMQMLHMLQNIIELMTKDRILYSRLRTLAQSGEMQHVGKNIASFNKKSKSFKDVVEDNGVPVMSIGQADIAGVAQDGKTPTDVPVGRLSLLRRLGKFLKRKKRDNRTHTTIMMGG